MKLDSRQRALLVPVACALVFILVIGGVFLVYPITAYLAEKSRLERDVMPKAYAAVVSDMRVWDGGCMSITIRMGSVEESFSTCNRRLLAVEIGDSVFKERGSLDIKIRKSNGVVITHSIGAWWIFGF